jgi:hypothetical protein
VEELNGFRADFDVKGRLSDRSPRPDIPAPEEGVNGAMLVKSFKLRLASSSFAGCLARNGDVGFAVLSLASGVVAAPTRAAAAVAAAVAGGGGGGRGGRDAWGTALGIALELERKGGERQSGRLGWTFTRRGPFISAGVSFGGVSISMESSLTVLLDGVAVGALADLPRGGPGADSGTLSPDEVDELSSSTVGGGGFAWACDILRGCALDGLRPGVA